MGLFKKEIVIRPNSPMTYAEAMVGARSVVNNFQNKAVNKKENGSFIDFFFADMFDARNGNLYRVFSDACATEYSMTPDGNGLINFDIIDNAILVDHKDRIEVLEDSMNPLENRVTVLENAEPTTNSNGVEAYVIG